jgi:hypothetical protein
MARTAAEKAADYERRYPESVSDFGQKVERQERLDLKARRSEGGRGVRYFGVPELPWHRERNEDAQG